MTEGDEPEAFRRRRTVDYETVEDVLALIEKRPTDVELFQLLGRLYRQQGRFEEAKAAYESALALDPNDPFTHLYLGNWFWFTGNRREALERFKHAARLLPDEAVVHWCQGDIYKAMGNYELAESAFKKAVLVDPDDAQARRKLSEWYEFQYGRVKS
jgi:protein O-mannosyl-transferase